MFKISIFFSKVYNKLQHILFLSLSKIIVFFPLKMVLLFNSKLITYITTEYIKKQLLECGKNISISFPIKTHGLMYIKIGNNFRSFPRLRLEVYDNSAKSLNKPEVSIGHNVSINFDCHIGCTNKIIIGNNVLFGSKVYITDHFHGDTSNIDISIPPVYRDIFSKGPVVIEDNVWIGEGVAIMPNVRIGKNSIIGSNAVVTKNIPENCVAGGNPAKIIKRIPNE